MSQNFSHSNVNHQDSDRHDSDRQDFETDLSEQSWTDLATIADVENWIAQHDRTLQQLAGRSPSSGHGVRLTLTAGGVLHLYTNGDGDIILDLETEAAWIIPVIVAATRLPVPVSRRWVLPGDVMTQLIFGLNPLIASSQPVMNHRNGSNYRPGMR
ncbi:MAG: hypothetical protein V4695_07075 [Pseudomonadota bacterium]